MIDAINNSIFHIWAAPIKAKNHIHAYFVENYLTPPIY